MTSGHILSQQREGTYSLCKALLVPFFLIRVDVMALENVPLAPRVCRVYINTMAYKYPWWYYNTLITPCTHKQSVLSVSLSSHMPVVCHLSSEENVNLEVTKPNNNIAINQKMYV